VPRLRTLHRGSRGRPVAPRGNITGFTFIDFPLIGKWIEMLKEIAPGIKRTMLIFNPNTSPYYTFFLRVAARTRIVSAAGIRPDPWKSVRPFKGIFCDDISEFESYMPSQAVPSLQGMSGSQKYARHPQGLARR